MAALIKTICDKDDVQTLFVVCGLGQSRSVPHYMSNSPMSLQQVTQSSSLFGSLLRQDTVEIQADKLCAANLMLGSEFKAVSEISTTTLDVIREIARNFDQNDIGSKRREASIAKEQARLADLYRSLTAAKYKLIWDEESRRSSEDMQDKLKVLVRDNPNLLKQIP